MAQQSQILVLADALKRSIDRASTRPPEPKAIDDMSAEEVMDAIDAWLAADSSREFKVRTNALGHIATLYSGGNPVACGKGRGTVNSLADALSRIDVP